MLTNCHRCGAPSEPEPWQCQSWSSAPLEVVPPGTSAHMTLEEPVISGAMTSFQALSGTTVGAGPDETVRLIQLYWTATWPAVRSWAMTVPIGWGSVTKVKPLGLLVRFAF